MAIKNLGKVVPEKGVDYWTEDDKQEILDEVAKTSLPSVTEDDNGKVLQVVNSAWVAESSPSIHIVDSADYESFDFSTLKQGDVVLVTAE